MKIAHAVDFSKEGDVKVVLESLEKRPLAERIRVVVGLLEAIESRTRARAEDEEVYDLKRGGEWGYL